MRGHRPTPQYVTVGIQCPQSLTFDAPPGRTVRRTGQPAHRTALAHRSCFEHVISANAMRLFEQEQPVPRASLALVLLDPDHLRLAADHLVTLDRLQRLV